LVIKLLFVDMQCLILMFIWCCRNSYWENRVCSKSEWKWWIFLWWLL